MCDIVNKANMIKNDITVSTKIPKEVDDVLDQMSIDLYRKKGTIIRMMIIQGLGAKISPELAIQAAQLKQEDD